MFITLCIYLYNIFRCVCACVCMCICVAEKAVLQMIFNENHYICFVHFHFVPDKYGICIILFCCTKLWLCHKQLQYQNEKSFVYVYLLYRNRSLRTKLFEYYYTVPSSSSFIHHHHPYHHRYVTVQERIAGFS